MNTSLARRTDAPHVSVARRRKTVSIDCERSVEPDEDMFKTVHDDYDKWRNHYIERWCNVSLFLLHAGLYTNILCCALLLGMYFGDHYKDNPGVWKAYVTVVLIGWCLAVLQCIHFHWKERQWPSEHLRAPLLGNGIPKWFPTNEERRIDPELGTVTFTEMCDGHADKGWGKVQLENHWQRLQVHLTFLARLPGRLPTQALARLHTQAPAPLSVATTRSERPWRGGTISSTSSA